VQASYDRAGNMIQNADAEIARMKRIMAEIDHLEGEFDKVRRIRDVIKELRKRVDELDRKMDQSRSSYNHGQGSSGGARRR
jgi:vacuolar-type H+-ATPase subunit I/STV1